MGRWWWCCTLTLSLPALATLIAEFLTELDLHHVTLVCNDWGGAQLVISPGGDGPNPEPRICAGVVAVSERGSPNV